MKTRSIVWLVVLGGAVAWANSASAEIVALHVGPTTFDGTSTTVPLPNVSIGLEGRVDLEFKPDGVEYGGGGWETNTGTLWCLADAPGGNVGQNRLQISNDSVIARLYTSGGYAVNVTVPFTMDTNWHSLSLAWKQGQKTVLTVDGTSTSYTNAYDLQAFTSTNPNHVIGATSANTAWYPSGFMSYFHGDMRNVVVQDVVPEPSTLTLLIVAMMGLVCDAWRRRR